MKYIAKFILTLKGFIIRLTESIFSEMEKTLREEDDARLKQSDSPIWYDKEYNEDEKGNMRWEFEIWNFGYSDAFDYCKDIWLAFGYNIVVREHIDYVETLVWFFSIDNLPCAWCFNDYPPYQYVILCTKETKENLARLEEYIKVVVDELNQCVKKNEIKPLM